MLRLTEEHVNRAFRIARWYGRRTRRAEISDLESAALEGLAKAARDWDPERGTRHDRRTGRRRSFWSFAFIRILGEMRDELRRFDYLTRDQRAKVVENESGDLALDDEELGWIVPLEPISLDVSLAAENGGDDLSSVVDSIGEPRNLIEQSELRDAVYRAGARLPERTRFIVIMRDFEGYSNTELAETLDLTEGRVSQLRGAGIDWMRNHIGDSLLDVA